MLQWMEGNITHRKSMRKRRHESLVVNEKVDGPEHPDTVGLLMVLH